MYISVAHHTLQNMKSQNRIRITKYEDKADKCKFSDVNPHSTGVAVILRTIQKEEFILIYL
jgi:hypothetical protein